MSNATLTVKNYRCFSEKVPVVIDIGKGFTSFIGPNNSGKSALLKLIHEFRHVFQNITINKSGQSYEEAGPHFVYNITNLGGGLLNVQDNNEIFCNTNDSNITMELALNASEFKNSNPPVLTKIRWEIKREHPWQCSVFFEWTPKLADIPRIGQPLEINGGRIMQSQAGSRLVADCNQMFTHIKNLFNSIYIGAFRNAINEGARTYFDISVGTTFISTWNTWKNGPNKAQNNKIVSVREDIKRLLGFDNLEINASPDQKTLQIYINNRPYLLREIGAGMAQLIIVLANVAIKNPAYILIDEPEINLHPSLQADFLTSLASYAREGIFFATHSMGLARADSERIYSVQIINDEHVVKPLENTPRYSEFLGLMGFSSYQEMGFETILLVEGVTDVKTIQQFLRKLNIEHKVVVLPLGGDALTRKGVEQELAEILRISAKVFALVDSERSAEGQQPKKERLGFQKTCKKLRINCHLTELRAIENYLSDNAVKAEKGSKYSALGKYDKLGSNPLSWGKSESWRIAYRMEWSELQSTDVGKFLIKLRQSLQKKK